MGAENKNGIKNGGNKKPLLPRMDLKPTTAKSLRTFLPLRIASVFVHLFSQVGQRKKEEIHTSNHEGNTVKKTKHVRLISIAASNYVEKVRWGLDLLEANPKSPIYYTEDLHVPGFNAFFTIPASNDQASQTPMIVISNNDDNNDNEKKNNNTNNVLWGSDKILCQLCNDPNTINLYPEPIKDEIQQMETDLGLRLGATARTFGYMCLLSDKKNYTVATKFLSLHCPHIEQILLSKMLPNGMAKTMLHIMKVKDCSTTSEQELRTIFQEISTRLETNGGQYIMDTSTNKYGFTAVDLTFAALSYFLIRPTEINTVFGLPNEEIPKPMLQLSQELQQTTAGQHVIKMYKKHRPIDPIQKHIVLKSVNQNRIPWLEMGGIIIIGTAFTIGILSL